MNLKSRVHLVLASALVVSVACNVAAAEPTAVGRLVAAWPPVALMLVVDVLGRVPSGGGWSGRLQLGGAAGVALVAAVASFSHMHSVALAAGESELVAWLFPLTVDGLAIVASVALVEINRPVPDSRQESSSSAVPLEVAPSIPDLNIAADPSALLPLVMLNGSSAPVG